MALDGHISGPYVYKVVGNARICGNEIVVEELHVVSTVHDGRIRQLDELTWTWHVERGRLAQHIFECVRIAAHPYLVFSQGGA